MTDPVQVGLTGVRMSGAAHRAELPLLVLGPSLGTSAGTLWTDAARRLADAFDVLAWDLPGHGHNRAVPDEPFSVADLAAGVLRLVGDVQEQRGDGGEPFAYAGVSVGGAVGLRLLLDHPDRVTSAVLLCTGTRILDPATWAARIEHVRSSGTSAVVAATAARWFPPGFLEREPRRGNALLHALAETVDAGYVGVCEALASFDVRDRLGGIGVPVLAVAGAADPICPPASLREVADGVRHGRLAVLEDTGHLAPAERPEEVAALVRGHVLGEEDPAAPEGLDARSRSLVALAAVVAGARVDVLSPHLREARDHGLTWDEIIETLREGAGHGAVDPGPALRTAQRVRAEEEDQ